MGKILPILLALIGIGAGVGAGLFLKPEAEEHAEMSNPCGEPYEMSAESKYDSQGSEPENVAYVKLNNQFIVPVVNEAQVESMVVLSLSVEVEDGNAEAIFAREPKLRDAFLQDMFEHANIGGFAGSFTSADKLDLLRESLRGTSRMLFGDLILDVLITDIARQDV